jgi:L-ascorbate metabolism protein UlaG (beta-lactamase superfamily)
MNRRNFLLRAALLTGGISRVQAGTFNLKKSTNMKIQFLRNATFLLETGRHQLLIDPMLSPQSALDPIPMAANTTRIPMVDLPLTESQLKTVISRLDAVLVTHTHPDHWDATAQKLLPKHLPIFCQPEDEALIRSQGFEQVIAVPDQVHWEGLRIYRTGGQHGTGEIGRMMAPVSGFILDYDHTKLYIAGDTIWCPEVERALTTHQPQFVAVNAGAAQFLKGDPITMTDQDVVQVCRAVPGARVIALHMEAINHCYLSRHDLRQTLHREGLGDQCSVPEDGETVPLLGA